jgi:hypothetical protein
MPRVPALLFPLGGLSAGLLGFLLWVSGIGLRALDLLVLILFVAGLVLSTVGYLRGPGATARRFSVLGIGVSGLGVVALAVMYAAG